MLSKKLILEIQQLISKGKTNEALDKISSATKVTQNAQWNKYLILLQSQWSTYKRDRIDNIKSDILLDRELNRINKSLLSLIEGNYEGIHMGGSNNTAKPLSKRLLLIGGILLIVISGFFFWNREQDEFADKKILQEYKIDVLDEEGYSQDVFVAKIYKDFTGQIIREGKSKRMESVQEVSTTFLIFSIRENQQLLEYSGIQPLGKQHLEGNVMHDGKILRKWMGRKL